MSAATTAPVRHADRFFIGGEWVEPSSDATDRRDRLRHRRAVLHDRGGRARRHVAGGRGRAARVRRRPVAAADARGAGRVHPRARRGGSQERSDVLGAAVAARVGRALQDRRSTPGGSAPGALESYAALGRHVPVRGGVPRRPAAASSACSCASRSAWSARSSRGTRRWRSSATRSAPRSSPAARSCSSRRRRHRARATCSPRSAEQIGLPPGVLNVVTADREVSELLVTQPGRRQDHVHGIDRGRPAHRVAVRRADRALHARARREVGRGDPRRHGPRRPRPRRSRRPSAALNGQVCSSLTRIIVTKNRHDELVEALAGAFSARCASATRSTSSRSSARSSSERQRDRVAGLHRQGCRRGRDARDRRRPPRRTSTAATSWSRRCSATSTTRRRSAARRSSGRCSAVIPADDEQDAVRIANDTIYGLNASVFTQRRRPGPRGGRSASLGHRRPQRLPHRLRHGVRRVQAVGHRSRGRQGRPAAVPRDQDRDPRRPAHGLRAEGLNHLASADRCESGIDAKAQGGRAGQPLGIVDRSSNLSAIAPVKPPSAMRLWPFT